MWRLWAIVGFSVWILIVSLALDPGTSRTLLTQLSALAIIVLALWKLSAEHETLMEVHGAQQNSTVASDLPAEAKNDASA